MKNIPFRSHYMIFRRRLRPRLKELALTFYVIRKSWLAVVGAVIVFFFIFITIFGNYLVLHDPYEVDLRSRLSPPSYKYLFGTDEMGRCVLSRMLAGARYSLEAGIFVLAIAAPVGLILGGIAGLYGGWLDEVIMRFTDIFLAFPYLILAMAISAALGPSLKNCMIALSLVYWPVYARLIRGQALSVREKAFVDAAKAMGVSRFRIMSKHILPNTIAPVIVALTLDMGTIIISTAALSFLGFGAQPPLPEWGCMISEGRLFVFQAWWTPIFPGLAIVLVVLGFNFMGDGIRDALDPKLRRTIEVEKK